MFETFRKLKRAITENPHVTPHTADAVDAPRVVVKGPKAPASPRRTRASGPTDIAQKTFEVLSFVQDGIAQTSADRYAQAKVELNPSMYRLSQEEAKNINFSAGLELLNIYQDRWRTIHQTHVLAANKAKVVRSKCTVVQRSCNTIWRQVYEVDRAMSTYLPELTATVQHVCASIDTLKESLNRLESGIQQWETALDERDTQRGFDRVDNEVKVYRAARRREYDDMKAQYDVRIRRREEELYQRERSMLEEKRAVYDQQHRELMEAFRRGSTPDMSTEYVKVTRHSSGLAQEPRASQLEDIDIRDIMDDSDLNAFFEGVDAEDDSVVMSQPTRATSDNEEEQDA